MVDLRPEPTDLHPLHLAGRERTYPICRSSGPSGSEVGPPHEEIEEILDAKGYPDGQRARIASLTLRGEAKFLWRGIQGRVATLDTPTTRETFRAPFMERYSPAPPKRKRDGLPLAGSSGGSAMEDEVAQHSECQRAACPDCGREHMGRCLLGQGKCFYCHQPGHRVGNCPRRKKTATLNSILQGDLRP
ncbi:Zinc finger, CCHC-type [Sesbania bispinosa]|nr:Zinc finger, CCHC-type [Sesbania bispinosa]